MYLTLFIKDETGAAMVDWVALTAGILILGLAVIFKIFNDGVAPTVQRSVDNANALASTMSAPRTIQLQTNPSNSN